MQDFLGAENTIVDNAFFDSTNNESFSSKKIQNVIKSSHYVDSTCYALSNKTPKNEIFWATYPNPVYNTLFVNSMIDSTRVKYSINDTNGRHIKSGNLDIKSGYSTIDMTNLPNGMYIISFKSGKIHETKKIMKA